MNTTEKYNENVQHQLGKSLFKHMLGGNLERPYIRQSTDSVDKHSEMFAELKFKANLRKLFRKNKEELGLSDHEKAKINQLWDHLKNGVIEQPEVD